MSSPDLSFERASAASADPRGEASWLAELADGGPVPELPAVLRLRGEGRVGDDALDGAVRRGRRTRGAPTIGYAPGGEALATRRERMDPASARTAFDADPPLLHAVQDAELDAGRARRRQPTTPLEGRHS